MAQATATVTFPSQDGNETLTGYYIRPSGRPRGPGIVALHGCGGPLSRGGGLSRRHLDWGRRWAQRGYPVLFPDSFGSRGYRSLCRMRPRPVRQRQRVGDAFAARAWLARQPGINDGKIVLVGWSNGGGTALRVARSDRQRRFRFAVAFYPGCRGVLRRADRLPKIPVTILMGAADDWTPPEPCVELARVWGSQIVLYPGAYHSFDSPGSRTRVRQGMAFSATGTGRVHVGTDPKARASAIAKVMGMLRALE